MKRILFLMMIFLSLASPVLAGFDEGKAAYDRKDWVKAIMELRPAAEKGDDRAMILIGNMYYFGYGVVQSYKEALNLYSRAADKNNTDGMDAAGAMYIGGKGVDKSLKTALQWFQRSAERGDQAGAFFCGMILYRGNNSPTDDIKPDFYTSYKWFKISARDNPESKLGKGAEKIAARIAEKKLSKDEVAKADKEVAAWKPVR